MSEDLSVLVGDPADLAEHRVERLGLLPRAVVERWLSEHDMLLAEDGSATWASSGAMVEIYLNLDPTGGLRSVDASLYGADDATYQDSRDTFLDLLRALATALGARVWSASEDAFV